jgi:hypothetical protein
LEALDSPGNQTSNKLIRSIIEFLCNKSRMVLFTIRS